MAARPGRRHFQTSYARPGTPSAHPLPIRPAWIREELTMNKSDIREHMEVIGSDGQRVGAVDKVDSRSIKLTKSSPEARGEHRYIPLAWVERVDQHVHLNKASGEVQQEWQAHPV